MGKYKKLFQEILSLFLALSVIYGSFGFQPQPAQAATYYMTQDSWSSGTSASTLASPFSTSTNTYYVSSTNITAGVNVYLSQSSYQFTDDGATSTTSQSATGGGFGNGTNSNTTVSGTGTGASVALAIDGGSGTDGAANMTTTTCSGAGISGTAPNCSIVGGTYNYTTFNISSGATTTVTGTSALIIKATGDVTIAGTINLYGSVGGSGGDGGSGDDDTPPSKGLFGLGILPFNPWRSYIPKR